jgi:hypothetical protein
MAGLMIGTMINEDRTFVSIVSMTFNVKVTDWPRMPLWQSDLFDDQQLCKGTLGHVTVYNGFAVPAK